MIIFRDLTAKKLVLENYLMIILSAYFLLFRSLNCQFFLFAVALQKRPYRGLSTTKAKESWKIIAIIAPPPQEKEFITHSFLHFY
jgi:hypothetical protein